MKRLHVFGIAALTLAAVLFGGAKMAAAYNFHTGNNVTTASGRQIHDTIYMAGRTVDIDSEIFGDVFCAGQNISVSGTVHGDVICAGQTVDVSGKVDGDVRLAGQTVTLGADVSGNATIGGQSFVLRSDGSIGGDATIGSTDATLNGRVGRDVMAGGNEIVIGSQVGRNIKAGAETLKLTSGARVGGNIDLTSKNNVVKDTGAVVSGKVTHTVPKQGQAKPKHGAIFGFGLAWFIYWFIAMLFTAMVLALLFPQMLQAVTDKALPRPWKALLTGFVAFVLMPVITVLFAATVIGLPLAFMLGMLWLAAMLLSGPLFGYYIGRMVLRESRRPLLIMLVGASILIVLYFIPILGILAILAALWTGTGMLLLEVLQRTPKPAYETAPAAPAPAKGKKK